MMLEHVLIKLILDGSRYLEGFEENTLAYRRIDQELDVLLIFHIKLM